MADLNPKLMGDPNKEFDPYKMLAEKYGKSSSSSAVPPPIPFSVSLSPATVLPSPASSSSAMPGPNTVDNNLSESALRKVVLIRDSALFAGSEDHAEAAGHILSLIASARLHGLEPEAYLRDLIRVLPFWPRDRFLELAPKFWAETRARLDARQLDAEVGVIDVPEAVAVGA